MVSILSLQYTNSFKFFMQFCFVNISLRRVNDLEFISNTKVDSPTRTFNLNRIKNSNGFVYWSEEIDTIWIWSVYCLNRIKKCCLKLVGSFNFPDLTVGFPIYCTMKRQFLPYSRDIDYMEKIIHNSRLKKLKNSSKMKNSSEIEKFVKN
jgi:hypothetical protein